jgi:hypothetical protein
MLRFGMFRDAVNKLSLRKKLTILAAVGVLLPILVLTYMQYRSLAELQDKTKGAFRDNVRQGLTVVQLKIKQRLEDIAAQTLNPIGSMRLSSVEQIEKYFADVKRSHPEVDEIFAFDKQSTNSHAHIQFLFDKARMAQSFLDGNRKYLFLHDSSPGGGMRPGTYLFYPLNDGFAGVLLSERFVSDDLIAGSIRTVAPSHTSFMAVTISDEDQRVLYSNGAPQSGYLLESNFDRPFSNWKAKVGLKNTNLDDFARNSFLHSAGATKHVWRKRNQISSQMSRMN